MKKLDLNSYRLSNLSEDEIKAMLSKDNDLVIVEMYIDSFGEIYHRVWDCWLHEPDGSVNGNNYFISTDVGCIEFYDIQKYINTYLCPANIVKTLLDEWVKSKETIEEREKTYKERIALLKKQIRELESKLSYGRNNYVNSNYEHYLKWKKR